MQSLVLGLSLVPGQLLAGTHAIVQVRWREEFRSRGYLASGVGLVCCGVVHVRQVCKLDLTAGDGGPHIAHICVVDILLNAQTSSDIAWMAKSADLLPQPRCWHPMLTSCHEVPPARPSMRGWHPLQMPFLGAWMDIRQHHKGPVCMAAASPGVRACVVMTQEVSVMP